MPTYEYRCRDCGHTFDAVQPMADDSLTVCPECGGALRKVFGAPMISFKGSGFYATDHGKKSKTKAEQKDSKGADSTSAPKGDGASSDSKSGTEKKSGEAAPAAKTESTSGPKAEPKSSEKKEPTT